MCTTINDRDKGNFFFNKSSNKSKKLNIIEKKKTAAVPTQFALKSHHVRIFKRT